MNQFYLVQRLEQVGKESTDLLKKYRFSEFFSLDYMGSSEFEWGSFPKFLRSMYDSYHHSKLIKFKFVFNDVTYHGFYDSNLVTEQYVLDNLSKIANDPLEYDLKDKAYFPTSKGEYSQRFMTKITGWAEIEKGVFWTSSKRGAQYFTTMLANSVAYMDEQKALREAQK